MLIESGHVGDTQRSKLVDDTERAHSRRFAVLRVVRRVFEQIARHIDRLLFESIAIQPDIDRIGILIGERSVEAPRGAIEEPIEGERGLVDMLAQLFDFALRVPMEIPGCCAVGHPAHAPPARPAPK